jgi:hypothetical protein
MRSTPRFIPTLVALGAILLSCERSRKAVPPDTARAVQPESTHVASAPPPPPAWDPAAGPVMFVRGNTPTTAYVVFPEYNDSTLPDTVRFDETAARNARLELLGHGGALGTGHVVDISSKEWSGDSCIEWPSARLQLASDSARVGGWTVALEPRSVQPVPLDSIEGLAPQDSARLAADITRLASALPYDTSRTFRGIPFAVRIAYRFSAASGVQALVADVVRKLNQEANPLEQHTLIVAERDSGGQSPYHVVYHERSAGSEESLETTDVLAALRFSNPSRIALVLLREGIDTSAYALLERRPSGQWRVRWTSVHTGC